MFNFYNEKLNININLFYKSNIAYYMQAILDYGNSNKINLKYNDFDLYLYNLVFADGSYKMNEYMGYMGIKPIPQTPNNYDIYFGDDDFMQNNVDTKFTDCDEILRKKSYGIFKNKINKNKTSKKTICVNKLLNNYINTIIENMKKNKENIVYNSNNHSIYDYEILKDSYNFNYEIEQYLLNDPKMKELGFYGLEMC